MTEEELTIGDLVHFRMDNYDYGLCVVKDCGKKFFKDDQYLLVHCATGEVYVAFPYEIEKIDNSHQ